MIPLIFNRTPSIQTNPFIQIPQPKSSLLHLRPIYCFQLQNPYNTTSNPRKPKIHLPNPILTNNNQIKFSKKIVYEERRGFSNVGSQQMLFLCGFGYWVQGFRCFPWLSLNFHMANNLNLHPSTLQLVQNFGNLPLVAKPLYGILSDAFFIGGARRIPYISIGVLLQILSWGSLAFIEGAGEALPTLMVCVLLGNIGAAITEVAKDALVAEYGLRIKMIGLQSYAFMALATGGILGNLLGGFSLSKTPPKIMFLIFAVLLSFQFKMALATREESLGLSDERTSQAIGNKPILQSIKKQYSDLMAATSEESIFRPLIWIVASTALVPIQSGSIFCYQTQCLNLDPSIFGMSRVISQLILLSMTVLYNRYWRGIPMRKLVGIMQILYACSLLLDLVLVKQVNLKLGIPNELFVLCFSGLAETISQFKLLPFQMLFVSLTPPGCEGSLMSFVASTFCLSSIFSGFLGVGLASFLGITSGDNSSLPLCIVVQSIAALVSVGWIHHVPLTNPSPEKELKRGRSKRTRKNRRVGRVVFNSVYSYRRERESEVQS